MYYDGPLDGSSRELPRGYRKGRMNGFIGFDDFERWQGRVIRWMTGLSLLVHAGIFFLGVLISPFFPPRVPAIPIVVVELTEIPLSPLPKEKPAPAPPVTVPSKDRIAVKSPPVPVKKPKQPSKAQKWLRKLDAGLPSVPDAPVKKGLGRSGGIPVRQWKNDASPRPGDFAPAVAPENSALLRQISKLEGKVRHSGLGGVGTGTEVEASVMFGGGILPWRADPGMDSQHDPKKGPGISSGTGGRLFRRLSPQPGGQRKAGGPVPGGTIREGVACGIRGILFPGQYVHPERAVESAPMDIRADGRTHCGSPVPVCVYCAFLRRRSALFPRFCSKGCGWRPDPFRLHAKRKNGIGMAMSWISFGMVFLHE